tara:strand:+ start:240 stop:1019 length:780 start_codon:yes stop_codon:yes gene_type:complete
MENIKYESIAGKKVVITGASGGIGEALSAIYAENGAKLILTDIYARLKIGNYPDGAILIPGDLSSLDSVEDLAKCVLDEVGSVDILINNAGLQIVTPVDEFPDKEWLKLIQVMLVAPFQLTKYFLPGMKKNKWGRIINISSIHGLVASPFKSAYVAAKHGLVGFTKTVATEVGEDGITANSICPGYVDTPLSRGQIKSQSLVHGIDEDEVISKIMLQNASIKELIDPSEIASLALFLSSDSAKSITGSAYSIDAGWTAR